MSQKNMHETRREFIKTSSGIIAGLATGGSFAEALTTTAIKPQYSIPLGVYAGYSKASFLKESGCTYIEESVAGFLIPEGGDEMYEKNLEQLHQKNFPIKSYVIL